MVWPTIVVVELELPIFVTPEPEVFRYSPPTAVSPATVVMPVRVGPAASTTLPVPVVDSPDTAPLLFTSNWPLDELPVADELPPHPVQLPVRFNVPATVNVCPAGIVVVPFSVGPDNVAAVSVTTLVPLPVCPVSDVPPFNVKDGVNKDVPAPFKANPGVVPLTFLPICTLMPVLTESKI